MSRAAYRAGGRPLGRLAVRDPSGAIVEDTYYNYQNLRLLPSGTSVSYDRLAESRASARIALEVLTPYGAELVDPLNDHEFQMYFGVLVNGEEVWTSMGYFIASNDRVVESQNRHTTTLTCVDPSVEFRQNPWEEPFAVAEDSDNEEAIRAILDDRAHSHGYEVVVGDINSETVPDLVYTEEDDPWAETLRLGQSAGAEVYYDSERLVRVRPVPAVRRYYPDLILGGDDYSIVEGGAVRSVNLNEVFGGVICKSEAPWLLFPVRAEVWDLDPASPTYSPEGSPRRAKTITDSTAGTTAQCLRIAEAEFERVAGVQYEISLTALKDPTIRVGGVALVTGGLLSSGKYIIDKINFPYGSTSMSLTMRKKE